MRAKVTSMSTADMDRLIAHQGDSPEKLAMDNEDSPENQRTRRRAALRDALEPKMRVLLTEEYAALVASQKGILTAYWEDCCKCPREYATERFKLSENAVGVAKSRALAEHRCGETRGVCERVPGCAHSCGEELWVAIRCSVASKLGFAAQNLDCKKNTTS